MVIFEMREQKLCFEAKGRVEGCRARCVERILSSATCISSVFVFNSSDWTRLTPSAILQPFHF